MDSMPVCAASYLQENLSEQPNKMVISSKIVTFSSITNSIELKPIAPR
jgi:hypothetical protein